MQDAQMELIQQFIRSMGGKLQINEIDLSDTKIDHKTDKYGPILNIQGGILKGHDRDHAVLFFLRFKEDEKQEVKKQISAFADYVTPFGLQMEEWELYHKHRIPGGSFGNFFLTAQGYQYLGFSKQVLKAREFDPHFIEGMQAFSEDLCDPEPQTWELGYRQDSDDMKIHAMILVADDDQSNLGQKVRMVLRDVLQIERFADIVAVEHAFQQRDEKEQPIEHFGFRDGISNPMFLQADEEKIREYGGLRRWEPWAPLNLVLVRDPLGRDANSFGSYLVYRKYEQHVRLFEAQIRLLARQLNMGSEDESDLEKVRALILGRFRDGTPVTLADEPKVGRYANTNYNDFQYGEDNGIKCPLHAHIRKVNTRPQDPENEDRMRRIVRRGMTYGKRNRDREKQGLNFVPNGGVGLLFMCFQSNIAEQFEHIQRLMANNVDFPEKGTNLDPLIGQGPKGTPYPPQKWPGKGGKMPYAAFNSCVTLKGGEYFFAPSISFLRNLSSDAETKSESQKVSPQFQPADFQRFMERYCEEIVGKKAQHSAKKERGNSDDD